MFPFTVLVIRWLVGMMCFSATTSNHTTTIATGTQRVHPHINIRQTHHPFHVFVRPCCPTPKMMCASVCSDPYCHRQNVTTVVAPAVSSEQIPTIDALYSPKFPLAVVRTFVMEALHEAVEVNQVHNRDPIGWSNENLFL